MRIPQTIGLFGELEKVMASSLFPTCTSLVVTAGLALAACFNHSNLECDQDASCDVKSGGLCVQAGSGNSWCAYPDPTCADGGYRYSDVSTGDGVGGACVAEGSPLTVLVGGGGSGTITSSPPGISCSSGKCVGAFPRGTRVQLSAAASNGDFLGWAGACAGTSPCDLTMDQAYTVDALFGVPGQALWATQLGGPGPDAGKALAVDRDNNIVTIGTFGQPGQLGGQTIQIGNATFTSNGGSDFYVAKLDGVTGAVIWAKSFGGAQGDDVFGVAIDGQNNVYIAGRIDTAANLGAGTITTNGSSDALVMKLSPQGELGWARLVGGAGFDNGTAIAVRGDSVVLAGNYTGSMTIDGKAFTSAGATDVFVYEMAVSNGAGKWAVSLGATSADSVAGVGIDGSNNVVVAGTTRVSDTVVDMYVDKLAAATGANLFSKRLTSGAADTLAGLAVDGADNIFVTGGFTGSLDLGNGTPVVATNQTDIFVAKYTLAGSYVWGRAFEATAPAAARSAAVNAAGDLVLAGDFRGTISFGGPYLSSADASFSDAFIVRLAAADGSHLKSARAGGAATEEAMGVGVATDGRFFVTGSFDGFAEFGGQALTPIGGADGYVLALAPL